jgi:hypothetical protein
MIINVKSPRVMNPGLEGPAHCSGRLLAKNKKNKTKQNKHNTLMLVLITKKLKLHILHSN